MICDLGLSRLIYDDFGPSSSTRNGIDPGGLNTTTPHRGTDRYVAPEMADLDNPSKPTSMSDVYAVGCIGFEVSTLTCSFTSYALSSSSP